MENRIHTANPSVDEAVTDVYKEIVNPITPALQ